MWGKFTPVNEKQERNRLERLHEDSNVQEEEEEEEEDEKRTNLSIHERRELLSEIMRSKFLDGKDHKYVNEVEVDADARLDEFHGVQSDVEDRFSRRE
ncbi:hypothetical protein P3T76_006877 [Phytophthora citrophthora]|uniref:CCD97-like C-terminal domain-containing protein n=1 Tax=Phytophthora citrophthora TaxID=4793 RepID=A0AAD9LLW3_9STRA|nr:hypothetical protein P3T76_006877 [Phytophthora citrophthora]